MANRIQIRRGNAKTLVGKQVYEGELLWVIDQKKLYIGTESGTVSGSFPKYESEPGVSIVKAISPDASEVIYNNALVTTEDKLSATTVQGAIDELATEKQNKLGGSEESDGKVVVATSTLGKVNYLGIDSTPTLDSSNLVTSGGVKDDLNALNNLINQKQNRPSSAIAGNIATFDANKDTVDSGKEFTTTVNDSSTDNQIPTALAVKTAINKKVASAVKYKGMCKESKLPTSDQQIGDFWTITDFDLETTKPELKGHNGRAIWNGTGWDKEVDEYFKPDNTTITLNANSQISIKAFEQSDTTDTATATFGGKVNIVDSVTRNGYGQVTGINTKEVTLPGLGKDATTAAQGDLAEYKENKTSTIRDASTADDIKYPTELAVRTELDKKVDKITAIEASTNFSLVKYNTQGIVTEGTDIIDGGSF